MTEQSRESVGGESRAAARAAGGGPTHGPAVLALRIAALSMVAVALLFAFNNYLIFWRGWPGVQTLFSHLGWFGNAPLKTVPDGDQIALGWLQLAMYLGTIAAITARVLTTRERTLHADSESLSELAAYIIRAAFWAVVLVGLADMVISFLRVEGFLAQVVGEELAKDLGRPNFRGVYVHYPLIGASLVIASVTRSLGFIWLALLVVAAELQIVMARFIFSYEQAFMADLVRFWYGGLFLFASAYTLIEEGHVRVDILYTSFSERGKAWSNACGSLLLGVPLCWVILTRGMWERTNSINGPLLNFEVTQAGYGMYVKYLMAGFLLIYALSMLVQFVSYFLSSVAVLFRETGARPVTSHETL